MRRTFPLVVLSVFIIPFSTFAANLPPTPSKYGYLDVDGGPPAGGGIIPTDRQIEYVWIDDLLNSQIVINDGDNSSSLSASDGIGSAVELGHPFPLFGVYQTHMIPTTNGYLSTLGTETGSDATPDCPFPPKNNPIWTGGDRIAAFHCDLDLRVGSVFYKYYEISPHPYRRCGVSVFTWYDVDIKGRIPVDPISFQVLLFDTGDVVCQYHQNNTGMVGRSFSIGMHSRSLNDSVAYQCSQTGVETMPAAHAVVFEPYETIVNTPAELAAALLSSKTGGKIRGNLSDIPFDLVEPITLTKSLVFDGTPGYTTQRLFRPVFSGGDAGRLFTVASGVNALFVDCDIVEGNADNGGAVRNDGGVVKFCRTNLRDHRASGTGGIISATGGVTKATECNFALGEAATFGGAVHASGGEVALHSCSFYLNKSGDTATTGRGGALSFVAGADVTMTNCTVSDNNSTGNGAAVWVDGSQAVFRHCTIVGNSAPPGISGGFGCVASQLTFGHTIIAGNGGNRRNEGGGTTILSELYNLDDTTGIGFANPLDLENTNPLLTQLGLHGGFVMTRLPHAASPVIDAGVAGTKTPRLDTRGFARNQNGDGAASAKPDIGAVEAGQRYVVTSTSGLPSTVGGLRKLVNEAPEGAHIVFDVSLSGSTIALSGWNYVPGTGDTIRRFMDLTQSFLFVDGSLAAQPVTIQGDANTFGPHIFYTEEKDAVSLNSVIIKGRMSVPVVNLMSSPSPQGRIAAGLLVCKDSMLEQADANWAWMETVAFTEDFRLNETVHFTEANNTVPGLARIIGCSGERLICENSQWGSNRNLLVSGCHFSDSNSHIAIPSSEIPGVDIKSGNGLSWRTVEVIDLVSSGHAGSGLSLKDSLSYLIERCSLLNNRDGGLFLNGAYGTVRNSTVSGNRKHERTTEYTKGGAAIEVVADELLIEHCTIYDNAFVMTGSQRPCDEFDDPDGDNMCNSFVPNDRYTGGVLVEGAPVTFSNSIVARNRLIPLSTALNPNPQLDNLAVYVKFTIANAGDFRPDLLFDSLGSNIFDSDEFEVYEAAQSSDYNETDPRLGPLFDHGGPAVCHMPLAVSPAIDAAAGLPAPGDTDVRGRTRNANGDDSAGAKPDIGAVEADQPVVVTTHLDENGTGANTSLREALAAVGDYGRITFKDSVSMQGQSIEIDRFNGTGLTLGVNKNMTIDATGLEDGMRVTGDAGISLLTVGTGHVVAIHAVSFIGGVSNLDGGGIRCDGDLLLTHSLIGENTTSGNGGGIWIGSSGSACLHNVTLFKNSAALGGALAAAPGVALVEFRHCTIYNNFADDAAGLALDGRANLFGSTILAYNNLPSRTVDNLSSGVMVSSVGFNLCDDNSLQVSGDTTTLVFTNPQLPSGVSGGGFSQALVPSVSSPAKDAGEFPYGLANLASLRDARGKFRQLGYANWRLDIGAYESGSDDRDGDLIPDDWETANGLDPNDPSDALVDGDCDGANHLEEYENGNDPWEFYGTLCDHRPLPQWNYGTGGGNVTFNSQSLTPPTQPLLTLGMQIESSIDLENWLPFMAPTPSGLGVAPGLNLIALSAPRPATFPKLFYRGRYVLNLAGVDLNGVDLSGVDFSGLDLSGVDFSGAILDGANFSGATLDGAEFDGASLAGARLYDVPGANILLSEFPGNPGEPVDDSLPEFYPLVDASQFSLGHPAGPGSQISHNTYMLAFAPGTTVAQANATLATVNGRIAGALPPVNPGGTGIFCIRTDAVNHVQSQPQLAALLADPNVLHVAPEEPVAPLAIPDTSNFHPATWSPWIPNEYSGGNWGVKYCRAPQLWNFNEAIQKKIDAGEVDRVTRVGILDTVVNGTHLDLVHLRVEEVSGQKIRPGFATDHGTKVTGIIGAQHGNDGIEGVTPFAKVYSRACNIYVNSLEVHHFGLIGAIQRELAERQDTRVVNISLGSFNETAIAAAGGMTPAQIQYLEARTAMFLKGWDSNSSPLLVNSGGNAGLDAKISTPLSYAALQYGARSIFVTEAIDSSLGLVATANWSSAVNGNISAPGIGVTATNSMGVYELFGGTSASSPFVTGAISYLFSLQPDLSNTQIETLIYQNRNAEGTGNGLDAWAAAMDIDRIYGGDAVLRMLLDIDDGSKDGNLRRDYLVDTTADQPEEDPTIPVVSDNNSDDIDGDGGIGDGVIDMADYRRARDWAVIATLEDIPTALDGRADHFKHDANRNGIVDGVAESYYPRNDFNGDGDGAITGNAAPVPGVLNGVHSTDLFVLQQLFNDPNYTAGELDDFEYETVDLHFALYWFADWNNTHAGHDITSVYVEVTSTDMPATFSKAIGLQVPANADTQVVDLVLSMPANLEYEVKVCGATLADRVYGETIIMTAGPPCTDHYFSPRAFDKSVNVD